MRESGILLHISSLPSPGGIGTLGKSAYDFVDFLKESGQKYWQVLPLSPTGYGDSPYQSFSTFAGNPYFIDLQLLVQDGLISRDDIPLRPDDCDVDYGFLYHTRFTILRKAFSNFVPNDEYMAFCQKERFWLEDYSMFMAAHDKFSADLPNMPHLFKIRCREFISCFKNENREDIEFYKFIQYKFFRQWFALKEYANKNGVKIIGDLPFYVSGDSADVWAHPEMFQLNDDLSAEKVAGVPPDAFSREGQLWGNPVYNWQQMEKDDFQWWRSRLCHSLEIFDIIRLDHFRGFESYYSISAQEKTAVFGKWEKGPGESFFQKIDYINNEDFKIIAEDLGIITASVRDLLNSIGVPGMKILQFAFDSDTVNEPSAYLPHLIDFNSVVYTGTHDNPTTLQWWNSAPETTKRNFGDYCNFAPDDQICKK